MLYVFQVDTGTMMTFEMRLAMDTVGNLKKAIAAKTDIPEDKQVLLISGGESLNNMQKVCSYSSAGTDTSPIFLFAKINIESSQPPALNVEFEDVADMIKIIESCLAMQPSLDTLVARTELAADLNEQAKHLMDTCERLVHDQHLQQQGWAAVTANLEDLTRAFRNKSETLLAAFTEFTKNRSKHEELLDKFKEDLERLDSIPILPTLLEGNKFSKPISSMDNGSVVKKSLKDLQNIKKSSTKKDDSVPKDRKQIVSEDEKEKQPDCFEGGGGKIKQDDATDDTASTATTNDEETKQSEDEYLDANQDTESKVVTKITSQLPSISTSDESPSVTLRQWIDFHDSHNSLERLIELCRRGLERFTELNAEQIRHEVQELLKSANNSSMKEIKGLEERLFGLEKLMVDAKKVVEEQAQFAASFHNNRERFSKIKDSTVLPDLSASHQQQLEMMLEKHTKMSEYRDRCVKAKYELAVNLHARLRWIMYIEQQFSDLDGKLMIYKENLFRLSRHFEIVDQIYKAPDLYLESVVEVLRRRRFARRYLHWANSIAKLSNELYETEMTSRKLFDEKLGSHFLSGLFPGLTKSYPPSFATKQPDPFDIKLPRITAADIQFLQANLSEELSKNLFIPKDIIMPHIISTPKSLDDSNQGGQDIDDLDDRQSLNPTPPSSPTR